MTNALGLSGSGRVPPQVLTVCWTWSDDRCKKISIQFGISILHFVIVVDS